MRLWAEVFNAAGTTLQGVVNLAGCQLSRQLDTIGSVKITAPATDPNASDLLAFGKQVYVWETRPQGKTLIAQGILLQKRLSVNASSLSVTWDGYEITELIRRENTWIAKVYDDTPFEEVVADLLPSGWAAKVDAGLAAYSMRYDGANNWKALLDAVVKKGIHVRLAAGTIKKIEVGAFGDDSRLRISNLSQPHMELLDNPYIALIERLEVIENGYELFNRVIPLAGGNGDAAMTLKRATNTTPYTVQSATVNERTQYYLEDTASIAAYGLVTRTYSMPNLIPIAPTTGAVVNAANQLHEWACALLERRKAPQASYSCTVKKLNLPVRPGDKVTLNYFGEVYQAGAPVDYARIDDLFWVVSIDENYSVSGRSATLKLSSVDMAELDAERAIAQGLSELKDGQKGLSLKTQKNTWEQSATITSLSNATATFTFSADTVELARARLTITRYATDDTHHGLPDGLTVTVDGLAISQDINGQDTPFLGGSSYGDSVTLDIEDKVTDYINSAVNIQETHTIEVSCLTGEGGLTFAFDVVEVIGSVRVD